MEIGGLSFLGGAMVLAAVAATAVWAAVAVTT